jgi:protein TonB
MFNTLLESRSHSERLTGGAIASVTAHATIIAAAILATAQARIQPLRTNHAVRVDFFPIEHPTIQTKRPAAVKHVDELPPAIDTKRINLIVPPIAPSTVPKTPIDFAIHPIGEQTVGPVKGTGPGGVGAEPADGGAFLADQVEKQVAFVRGVSPRYPEALRSSGVEGQVVALFVVNEKGLAEADSVRFLRSDNALFEVEVRRALPRMRFIPAEIGGRKVRQLVQMPFVFTIGR